MIFFALTILLVLGGLSVYIYSRISPLMPQPGTWQNWLGKGVFAVLMFAFFIGWVLQGRGLYALSTPFTMIGSWLLAAMLYLFLVFLMLDVLRLICCMVPRADFLSFRFQYGDPKAWVASVVGCSIVVLMLVAGYFNARHPVVRRLQYQTSKNISRDFKYILISDVHLGIMHCDGFMETLRDRINSEPDVDFVVIAGDFFDGDPYPVVNSRVGEILRQVNAGYGIFAAVGNHEWIGDVDVATDFMSRSGVTVLRDSISSLPFGVTIIGRDDKSLNYRSGRHRKPMKELVAMADTSTYCIALDHQPSALEEAAAAGVDIQLSGHTHGGAQLWPFFLITKRMFLNDHGQFRIGNTDFYTSSGYGTWGPPVRTSASPEMVVVEVRKPH